MNFYEHQDRARRRTGFLVVLFLLAVAIIVFAVNAVVLLAASTGEAAPQTWQGWFASSYGWWTTGSVLGLIGAGTGYTSLRLAGGGKALAQMVGARPLHAANDVQERQLRNVVEEMSIASGTPQPALYVLDNETDINAFVAGTRPTQTVMVVTRGALDAFTRDELQGVVAHEYSHIFHQDMRVNMRLMGMLAGILLISRLGRGLMRAGSNSGEKSGGQAALMGFALFVIGYLGVLLGSLIQAAVSRQREYLADASAVQYTRNANDIVGALYRIGHGGGSRLRSAHAGDLGHFCFSEATRPNIASWFATHPPLAARIEAIAPGFVPPAPGVTAATQERPLPAGSDKKFAPSAMAMTGLAPAMVAASAGTLAARELATATHADLPLPLLEAARGSAPVACVYALLISAEPPAARSAALAVIAAHGGDALVAQVQSLLPIGTDMPVAARLPLLNVALPALQNLGAEVRLRMRHTIAALVAADGELSLFEFAAARILDDHLGDDAGRAVQVRHFRFAPVAAPLRQLLAILAWAGARDAALAQAAFARAYLPFSLGPAQLPARDTLVASSLVPALIELAGLSPLLKKNVITACADCVIEDGRVMAAEAELLQAIALSLDCPLPPLPAAAMVS